MNLVQIVRAAENGVVGCSGSDCTVCGILETISNAYNFLTGLSFAVAVLFLALAGLIYIFTTGRKSYFQKAKTYARSAILGFIFVSVGWIAIHAVMFSTGYQNSGSWWQFRCDTAVVGSISQKNESTNTAYYSDSLGSLHKFPDLAAFIKSNESRAIIKGPLDPDIFLNQFKTIANGQGLSFSTPAKLNNNGEIIDVQVPFLAGYKTADGKIALSASDLVDLSSYLGIANGVGDVSNEISLVDSSGQAISNKNSSQSIKNLVAYTRDFLANYSNSDSSSINNLQKSISSGNYDPAAVNDEVIVLLRDRLASLEAANPKDDAQGMFLSKATTDLINKSFLVVEKTDTEETLAALNNYSFSDLTNAGNTSNGDRSTATTNSQDKSTTSGSDSTSQSTKDGQQSNSKDWSVNPDSQKWQSTQPSTSGNTVNPSNSGGEDFSGWQKDKQNDYTGKNDNMNEGGERRQPKNAAERALLRIFDRDPLRYEMIHRFVRVIENTDFPGGLCRGCGAIEVNFSLPLKILDQVIVHESTHSGHFCIGMAETAAEVERIAVGNQIGSLDRKSCDKHEEKKNYFMREFDRQGKEVIYKGIPVRGYMSRWQTKVSPKGDLEPSAYDWPINYALSKGDHTYGPYHYGDHESSKDLGLKQKEEKIIEEIMEDRRPCFAKAKPNLPEAGECEKTGGQVIDIRE